MIIEATNKSNICQLSIQVCGFFLRGLDSAGVRKRLVREQHGDDDEEEVIEPTGFFGIRSGLKISSRLRKLVCEPSNWTEGGPLQIPS